ncbi:glycoside hydrolase family 76 protein [Amycolatopsis sp. H20-H5]|uniref:glycoside hydrolase family 76 protein n=1 Tax=Amycolatopsis sp. H20-H5 TaxID=3046309 RepID=UPI002DB588D1|nr:glycoside hydrolase family 76 protein [Amycolatopsis sp. H20-H5]MEC3978502.1 glycoside hydrolase family 76 protein [Amycolatopsis sp. H20-H5]
MWITALLAAAVVSSLLTPAAPATAICAKYCDGRDPAVAAGDRAGGSSAIWSRTVALHLSDGDDMGWASIGNGSPGDETWLDRSFDGGRTWSADSRIGTTTIPAGQRGWRTLMFNVDDPGTHRFGALRACGKAGDRPEVTCTPWVRTTVAAANRTEAAATALMQYYDNGTGLWQTTGWWNSANALTSILDYSVRTGSPNYRYAIGVTFDKNHGANFTNDYLDDTGWWALAWIRAFDLTGERRYLDTAVAAANYLYSYRDGTCGGGLWWSTAKTYKNAVTNELFVKVAASLHNRLSGDSTWLSRANQTWAWFAASGMITGSNLVDDGLNGSCAAAGTVWSYNQGIVLGALTELNRATGDAALLTRARQIADAATTTSSLNSGGILRDPCETGDCGADGPSFKGAFARGLGELDRALPGRPYHAYLVRQANSTIANNHTPLDQHGLHWAGPLDKTDAARQHSALDVLVAAL